LGSEVDKRFGRANFLIVVETATGQFTTHDNAQHLGAALGAGIQVAKHVVDLDVNAVITGHVGPKALTTLRANAVKAYIAGAGSVNDAVEELKADHLECLSEPNVDIDWV
jgi:predicted Fe-Mo cluster-binding NifX family protein